MRENGQLMVVPMKTMDGCEEAGQKLVSSERFLKGKFGKISRDISFSISFSLAIQVIDLAFMLILFLS